MKDIFSSRDYRLYKIMNYFLGARFTTLSKLSENTGIPVRTLDHDIEWFNDICEPIEIVGTREGIMIHIPRDYTEHYMFRCLLSTSTEFRIIEQLFRKETLTFQELEKMLYMSEPKLRRTINELNKKLEPYNILIKKNPLRFAGDTTKIAQLMYSYFLERYTDLDELISQQEISAIQQFLDNLDGFEVLEDDVQGRRRWIIWFYVKILLTKEEENHGEKLDFSDGNLHVFESINQQFLVNFGREISPQLFRYALTLIESENNGSTYEELVVTLTGNNRDLFTGVESFITRFLEQYGLGFRNYEELVTKQYRLLKYGLSSEFRLTNTFERFVDQLRVYNAYLVESCSDLFKQCFDPQFNSLKDQFIHNVILHWNGVSQVINSRSEVIIGVYLDSSQEHANLVKSALENNFEDYVTVVVLECLDFSALQRHVVKEKCDIVLTNIAGIKLRDCDVVCINEFMYEDIWKNLRDTVRTVRINKKTRQAVSA